MSISEEDKKKIQRKIRRDTAISIPTKVHKNKKNMTER